MNALTLTPVDGEPRVDSRFIAKQLGVEHKATYQLVRIYRADLEQLGLLPFEMEAVKIEGGRGTKSVKFALLNEDQSYLLLTYSQNTPQARALKIRLVRTFGDYRRGLAQPAIKPPLPDMPLVLIGGEPRIFDLTLAERLGFPYPARIRERIRRNQARLQRFGICATVAQTSGKHGGKPAVAYYLNQQQAVWLCKLIDPTTVFDVQVDLTIVFNAYLLPQPKPYLLPQPNPEAQP